MVSIRMSKLRLMLETLTTNESIFYAKAKKAMPICFTIAKQGFVKVRVDGKITTSPPE
jgi:hypothetical protein